MPKISALTASTALTADDYLVLVDDPAGTPTTKRITAANAATYFGSATAEIVVALSDETTNLTTGTAKLTMRMPYAMTLTAVRSSINTVSSSGVVTVDINDSGTTILSTKLSIDQGEKTSTTAATPAVISDSFLADDAEITFDIDAAGTGAKGLKVALIGTRGGEEPPADDIEFVAASNTTYASRTTTTVDKPTGTTDGDYILLGIFIGTATEAVDPTPPAGFTLLTGFPIDATDGSFNGETRIYGRVASSEGASWDFTHSSSASQGFALTYRNVNTGTPLDVNPTVNNGTGSTATATGLTTATDGAMVVYVAHDWGSAATSLTAPTGTPGVTWSSSTPTSSGLAGTRSTSPPTATTATPAPRPNRGRRSISLSPSSQPVTRWSLRAAPTTSRTLP
jgi:hypothetical protein